MSNKLAKLIVSLGITISSVLTFCLAACGDGSGDSANHSLNRNDNVQADKDTQPGNVDHKTGPGSSLYFVKRFNNNADFAAFVREFNTQGGRTFVSFDFKDAPFVSEKGYSFAAQIYPSALGATEQIYDDQVSEFSVSYDFYSYHQSPGNGAENVPFHIECSYDYEYEHNFPSIFVNTITFERVDFNGVDYVYKMRYDGRRIMDITISIEYPHDDDTVEDILKLLNNSMVFI